MDSSNKIQMDLWGLTNANGLQDDTSNWSKLAIDGTPPTARAHMAGAYDETSDTLILFGGGAYSSSAGTLYNETWTIRDVTSNPSWHKLNPAGTLPTARRDASAVYDAARNRLIVFGGNTSTAYSPESSGRTNDTWILSNANGTGGTPAWSQLNTLDKPPARSGHTAIFDSASKRMVVFAGGGTDNYVRDDVWVLTNPGETTSSWAEYDAGRPCPKGRVSHSAVYTGSAKNRMIIFGGNTGNWNLVNDVWALRNANGLPATPVRDISIKAASASLCTDYTLQLTAVATGDASDNEVSGALYTWSSSDSGIATVSSTGLVKGAGPGTATVTVTFTDVSGQTITSQFVITIAGVPATEVAPPTGTEPVIPPAGMGKSVYDGTYIGMFTYEYQEHKPDGKGNWVEGEWITDVFRLTVTFKHIATVSGITTLEITEVICSDASFGTGLAGITPSFGSVAVMPAEPPTTPINPSQDGMGVAVLFPDGASLLTENRAGALHVSSDGRTLSNSLDPGIQDKTWVAVTTQGPLYSGDPSGVYYTYKFKSWSLTRSNK
ncbi:MAG TPA: Ig-like domain-containing protein [Dehalococcoidia bacterium]|nr:Ig-like domain-containing protein [Dehalococcoidia bacterium]